MDLLRDSRVGNIEVRELWNVRHIHRNRDVKIESRNWVREAINVRHIHRNIDFNGREIRQPRNWVRFLREGKCMPAGPNLQEVRRPVFLLGFRSGYRNKVAIRLALFDFWGRPVRFGAAKCTAWAALSAGIWARSISFSWAF